MPVSNETGYWAALLREPHSGLSHLGGGVGVRWGGEWFVGCACLPSSPPHHRVPAGVPLPAELTQAGRQGDEGGSGSCFLMNNAPVLRLYNCFCSERWRCTSALFCAGLRGVPQPPAPCLVRALSIDPHRGQQLEPRHPKWRSRTAEPRPVVLPPPPAIGGESTPARSRWLP